MRTTLTIDDDVAIRLERMRDERGESFKSVVNEVLRRGLKDVDRPHAERPPYRIKPHDAGRCYLPKLDKTADVLAWAEGDDFK
jgi:hypothetical protein